MSHIARRVCEETNCVHKEALGKKKKFNAICLRREQFATFGLQPRRLLQVTVVYQRVEVGSVGIILIPLVGDLDSVDGHENLGQEGVQNLQMEHLSFFASRQFNILRC